MCNLISDLGEDFAQLCIRLCLGACRATLRTLWSSTRRFQHEASQRTVATLQVTNGLISSLRKTLQKNLSKRETNKKKQRTHLNEDVFDEHLDDEAFSLFLGECATVFTNELRECRLASFMTRRSCECDNVVVINKHRKDNYPETISKTVFASFVTSSGAARLPLLAQLSH